MSVMSIASKLRDYRVRFVVDAGNEVPTGVGYRYILDETVWRLYRATKLAALPQSETFVLTVSEELKTLETVEQLYEWLSADPAKRNLKVVSIGGGILQDVSGFACSTLYRGLDWTYIPTTLLAQADSCIGAKTSLNFRASKNLVGTFFAPSEVIIDVGFLSTQSELDFFSGVGEVAKLHLIGGRARTRRFTEILPGLVDRDCRATEEAVRVSLEIKREFIVADEFDQDRRNLLNFGHCFGHALESTSEFRIPHGQAVLIGMLFANLVSRARGMLSPAIASSVASEVLLPCLRTGIRDEELCAESIVAAMSKDKKRTGDLLAMILFRGPGELVRLQDVRPDEISAGLGELQTLLRGAQSAA